MISPRLPARLIGGICLLLIALGGCGTGTTTADPTREEAAIYAVIFSYMEQGYKPIHTIDPETHRGPWILRGPWTRDGTVDCGAFQTDMIEKLPEIMPGLASDFCAINQTARPVNPDVIRLLSLDTADFAAEAPPVLLKLSTIQLDSTKHQALVFVELRDDTFFQGSYILLKRYADGPWYIGEEITIFIS